MGLNYPPKKGDILRCDFSTGFIPPEMVKVRLVVVMNNRLPKRDGLCSVVPLSTTPAPSGITYQVKIDLGVDPPHPYSGRVKWAKADMMACVSYDRLSLPFDGKCSTSGKRKYVQMRLPIPEMEKVQKAVLETLHLSHLMEIEDTP
ncbi:type II toxin-antitoxin system PemK/MazF family toxin [Acetobacter orientalis]|uniref:type II toxin-antitoxin system PemK/MazF family toxin n=1 Tax=Acetobacter orientalis TaxID=146474 RepID=UPI0039E8503F